MCNNIKRAQFFLKLFNKASIDADAAYKENPTKSNKKVCSVLDYSVEGKVDEGEVSKLKDGMELTISLAAIEEKTYPANLKFIAPKGVEEAGAVQLKIEAEVLLDTEYFVRAGYSANASIITAKRENRKIPSN